MNNTQLREFIIRPTLIELGMYSQAAEDLVAGTIAQESDMGHFIKQRGAGPALGICQMEPDTHKDLWENFIQYRPHLSTKLRALSLSCHHDELIWNLKYAVAMCRVHYLRQPNAIPEDVEGQAAYWKKYYNTLLGKGTAEEYVHSYNAFARR